MEAHFQNIDYRSVGGWVALPLARSYGWPSVVVAGGMPPPSSAGRAADFHIDGLKDLDR